MTKEININEVAQSIADVTLELMYDSVDWQLSEYEADGDDYVAIHAETMQRAIEIMYHQTRKI
jgi:thiamine biosynthesis protein ThiC